MLMLLTQACSYTRHQFLQKLRTNVHVQVRQDSCRRNLQFSFGTVRSYCRTIGSGQGSRFRSSGIRHSFSARRAHTSRAVSFVRLLLISFFGFNLSSLYSALRRKGPIRLLSLCLLSFMDRYSLGFAATTTSRMDGVYSTGAGNNGRFHLYHRLNENSHI